jgi:hypothetical protein
MQRFLNLERKKLLKFAEVEAKNFELEAENTKLRAELKSRIKELEKSRVDSNAENARRDVRVEELEQKKYRA